MINFTPTQAFQQGLRKNTKEHAACIFVSNRALAQKPVRQSHEDWVRFTLPVTFAISLAYNQFIFNFP